VTHPYKEILIAIANGEQVQWQSPTGEWLSIAEHVVLSEIRNPTYAPDRYRVKPKTININGIDVPEPVREALEEGTLYWLVADNFGDNPYRWGDYDTDGKFLTNGWIHLTKEAAETHHRALVSFTKREAS
jgi:hypothetical protein